MKKILCVDFDGVLHSYPSGWQGADTVTDRPVPGAIDWLEEMTEHTEYEVQIYSSRSSQEGGVEAMVDWLLHWGLSPQGLELIKFPIEKPPAYLTIDDRAITFRGTFPSVTELANFKPWNR